MSETFSQCVIRRMLDWLPSQSPSVWHQIAMSWNWGDDIAPLAWIAAQPNCDKGTAQTIFWNGEPGEYADVAGGKTSVPSYQHDVYDLLVDIVGRWNCDFYQAWRYRTLPDILGDFRFYNLPPANSEFVVDETIRAGNGSVDFDEIDVRLMEGQPVELMAACFKARGEEIPRWILDQ